jgi:lysophospholipase L1-like esterase
MHKYFKYQKASKKEKVFATIFITNIILIISAVYGFEYYLSSNDPAKNLPFNGTKNGELYTWGHKVINNSLGFREREIDIESDKINSDNGVKVRGVSNIDGENEEPKTFRIMVLGDSLTWGAGLSEEQRYSNILENELNKKIDDVDISVYNFGVQGGPTTAERDILNNYKEIVKPDLIIAGFCLNDPQPKGQNYVWEEEEYNKKFTQKYGFIISNITRTLNQFNLHYIEKTFNEAIYNTAKKINNIPDWQVGLGRTYEKNSIEWKEFEQALKDIKKMSDEMALPNPIFASLNLGLYSDAPTDYKNPNNQLLKFLNWRHQAEETASKIGFQTLNFEKEIAKKLPNTILGVNVLDGHPSAELNKLYADKITEFIINKNIIR